jgi:hypothetical protein
MAKSSDFKSLFVCLWLILCPVISHAEIYLDKITACEDIANVYKSMKNGTFIDSAGCRLPHSILEKEVVARSGLKASDFCFTELSPASFLEGFSCFTFKMGNAHSLNCFRTANENDIDFYKEHYKEDFSVRESKYLSEAKKCSASNGDSARATNTLLPLPFQSISSFEFGFISQLGNSMPSNSAVVHGYAKTDQEIDSEAPSAIEFVSIYTDAQHEDNSKHETIGNWDISIDEADEADNELNKELRRRGIPINWDITNYSLTRSQAMGTPDEEKLERTEGLQYAIAKILKDEDFKRLTDNDLQKITGMDSDEMLDKISQQMPFGFKKGSPMKLGRKFLVFVNEKHPICTKHGDGAMGVYLMSTQPTPEVKSDFGSLGVLIIGIGECARYKSPTRAYIEELKNLVKDQVLIALKHE